MASFIQRHQGSLRQEVSGHDVLKYTIIAAIALLGIAGVLQGIAGSSHAVEDSKKMQNSGVYNN